MLPQNIGFHWTLYLCHLCFVGLAAFTVLTGLDCANMRPLWFWSASSTRPQTFTMSTILSPKCHVYFNMMPIFFWLWYHVFLCKYKAQTLSTYSRLIVRWKANCLQGYCKPSFTHDNCTRKDFSDNHSKVGKPNGKALGWSGCGSRPLCEAPQPVGTKTGICTLNPNATRHLDGGTWLCLRVWVTKTGVCLYPSLGWNLRLSSASIQQDWQSQKKASPLHVSVVFGLLALVEA